MSTELVSLSGLADEINAAHEATVDAAKSAVLKAVAVGELLSKAKERVPHGQWGTWVDAKCRFGARQAQKYLRCYENRTVLEEQMRTAGSHLGVNSLLATIADPVEKPGRDDGAPTITKEEAVRLDAVVTEKLALVTKDWREVVAIARKFREGMTPREYKAWLEKHDASQREALAWWADHPEEDAFGEALRRFPEFFGMTAEKIAFIFADEEPRGRAGI